MKARFTYWLMGSVTEPLVAALAMLPAMVSKAAVSLVSTLSFWPMAK